MKEKIKSLWYKTKIMIRPFLSWKVLLIYLPIYFLCTGWTYICLALPNISPELKAAAAAWCAFLWLPFSEEKLVTIPLTLFLYKKIFLNPKKRHNLKEAENIKALEDMFSDIKEDIKLKQQLRKERRIANKTARFINKTKK